MCIRDRALTARLAELGAQALSEAVEALRNGTASRTPQDASRQTHASMLSREMSPIDWNRTARQINCQVRGLIPWPCATTELAGQRFKIYETALGRETAAAPGTVLSAGKQGIEVACGDGRSLYLTQLQAEGGKMCIRDSVSYAKVTFDIGTDAEETGSQELSIQFYDENDNLLESTGIHPEAETCLLYTSNSLSDWKRRRENWCYRS